jgi:hypothetical protein
MNKIIKKALTDKDSRDADTLREMAASQALAYAPWS